MKPPANECPEEFCFDWAPAGSRVALGVYPNAREGLRHVIPVREGTCVCPFGLCKRLYFHSGLIDWYEPHEPALEQHGPPWFYFIPGPHKVVHERREEYIRESRRLWGVVDRCDVPQQARRRQPAPGVALVTGRTSPTSGRSCPARRVATTAPVW